MTTSQPTGPFRTAFASAATVAIAAAMCAAAYFVGPAGDDWSTMAPLLQCDWTTFRPGLFWRPFEQLIRVGLGRFPDLMPALPHTVTLAGQLLASWSLYLIVSRGEPRPRAQALTAVALFWVWPGAAAAILSVDTANQTWSTGCGLLATHVLLRARSPWSPSWLVAAVAATLWKESGIAWLVVAPLLAAAVGGPPTADGRELLARLARGLSLGLSACVAYFVVRAALADTSTLGAADGRYSLSLHPLVWGPHVAMLWAAAVVPMDTVALLSEPRRLIWFGVTCAAGSALVFISVRRAWTTLSPTRAGLLVASGLALAAPHAVLQHTSELYAHPLTAVALIAGCMAWRTTPTRRERLALGVSALAVLSITAAKAWAQIESGRRASGVGSAVANCGGHPPPSAICVVVASARRGYSVFDMDAATASAMGRAAAPHWKWAVPSILAVQSRADCVDDPGVPIVVFDRDDFSVERCESTGPQVR